jgi:diguanylate cyclase (GGDEF)-like protein
VPVPNFSTASSARSGAGVGTLAIGPSGTGGPLTAAAGATGSGGGTGGTTVITGALAPGTTAIGTRGGAGVRGDRSGRHRDHITLKPILPPIITAGTVIHFISVIPTGVWIALAVALALALGAGIAAYRSRRQVRLQAGQVAAVTAAALTDPLTGVLNRRGFLEAAERELDRARRYGHPLALAFVDIRGLKAVNDTEGHLAGDRLLERVTMLLRESARTHDLVGRIGGDELAVLLAEQSADGAAAMTQRVRAQIPAYRASLGLVTAWDVTIGTSAFPEDGEDLEQLLDAADRRLYQQRGINLAG